MKKATLETIRQALCAARDDCDNLYDKLIEKQLSAKTEDQRILARCDKERYGYISETLSEIIYRIEDWQTI